MYDGIEWDAAHLPDRLSTFAVVRHVDNRLDAFDPSDRCAEYDEPLRCGNCDCCRLKALYALGYTVAYVTARSTHEAAIKGAALLNDHNRQTAPPAKVMRPGLKELPRFAPGTLAAATPAPSALEARCRHLIDTWRAKADGLDIDANRAHDFLVHAQQLEDLL